MKTTLRNALLVALAGSFLSAPVALADNFNAIPKSGKAAFDAWPHYFWSYFGGSGGISGGMAYRFADNVSPAEQFDKGFGNAAKLAAALPKIQAFGECAAKAKSTCMPVAGASHRMNQDCLKKADIRAAHAACKKDFALDTATAHEVVNQGIGKLDADFWWGVCHGWSAAAVLFKEPVKNVVYNGVTFRPGDIKAYLTAASTDIDLAPGGWVGTRYDGPASGAAALADVSPAQYHATMGKFLGSGKGLVVDRHTGAEVWNQPADRFETTCAAGGTGCTGGALAQTCKTSFTWAEDNSPSAVSNGNRAPDQYTTRNLNYTLCIKDGLISGDGHWNHDPNADKDSLHPDFIWVPGTLRSGGGASNPLIATRQAEWIKALANPSAGVGTTTGGGTTPAVEKKVAVAVNKAIPDNSATGLTVTAALTGAGKLKTFATCLNILHTYRGDMSCTASFGGKTAKVWNKEGGSADNIQTCISHPEFTGLPVAGTASVKCADLAKGDTGTWVGLEVRYTVQ